MKTTSQSNLIHTIQNKIESRGLVRTSYQTSTTGPTKKPAIMLSSRECITWSAIYAFVHIAIVTFNAISIAVFVKNYQLRKRSTYLLLNLAVVDMAVGFTGLWTVYELGLYCKLWKGSLKWWEQHPFAQMTRYTFALCSLINITIISLERLHATVRPFRHRFVSKWVYWVIISVSYLIAVLFSVISFCLSLRYSLERSFKAFSSFTSACIIIIFFSYSVILIKVKCSPQPRHHVVAGTERRLTGTLFFVTFVSLLMWTPYIVQSFLWFKTKIFSSYPSHLTCSVISLVGLNSLVNPILYVIRIPQFNKAVKALFCKTIQRGKVGVLPLHAIPRHKQRLPAVCVS